MRRVDRTSYIISCVAAALLLPAGRAGAQGVSEYERLRLENIHLRESVDSLQRELRSLRGTAVINLWDELEGVEDDEGFEMDYGGFGLGGRKVETGYARGVLASVPSLSIPYDAIISKYVTLYSVTKRKSMAAVIGRYEKYLPEFRRIFASHGVPEDLIAICIVESAVSQKAKSHAGAVGMWQFMAPTARQYGLRVDADVDDRYNVLLSCDAAARMLRDLRRSLGSWAYAVLAYNCGAGNVRKAIIRSGNSRDVWETASYLPGETQAYLPALVGVRFTLVYADKLGITPKRYAPERTDAVTVAEETTIPAIAEKAGVTAASLYGLNAEYLTGRVPAGSRVRLPLGTGKAFDR